MSKIWHHQLMLEGGILGMVSRLVEFTEPETRFHSRSFHLVTIRVSDVGFREIDTVNGVCLPREPFTKHAPQTDYKHDLLCSAFSLIYWHSPPLSTPRENMAMKLQSHPRPVTPTGSPLAWPLGVTQCRIDQYTDSGPTQTHSPFVYSSKLHRFPWHNAPLWRLKLRPRSS